MKIILDRLDKMDEQIRKQSNIITENITTSITKTIEEKMKFLTTENQLLKTEIESMKTKVQHLEKAVRNKNLILHGVPEKEENDSELLELTLETLNKLSVTTNMETWDKWELSKCYRIGKPKNESNRPILISVTLEWRRGMVLKNNKMFEDGIYATEDLPKEVLNKRKDLLPELKEAREKGKIAYFSYDKLIVKEKTNEKRKRATSDSPTAEDNHGNIQNPSKINTMTKYLRTKNNNNQ